MLRGTAWPHSHECEEFVRAGGAAGSAPQRPVL